MSGQVWVLRDKLGALVGASVSHKLFGATDDTAYAWAPLRDAIHNAQSSGYITEKTKLDMLRALNNPNMLASDGKNQPLDVSVFPNGFTLSLESLALPRGEDARMQQVRAEVTTMAHFLERRSGTSRDVAELWPQIALHFGTINALTRGPVGDVPRGEELSEVDALALLIELEAITGLCISETLDTETQARAIAAIQKANKPASATEATDGHPN